MYSRVFLFPLGSANTGYASSMTLTFLDGTGAPINGLTIGAIAELSAVPGSYYSLVSALPTAQAGLAILQVSGHATLNTAQAFGPVPVSDVVNTVSAAIASLPTGVILQPQTVASVTAVQAVVTQASIQFKRGTTESILISLTDPFNSPINLTGGVLDFMVKSDAADADAKLLLQKTSASVGGITIVNAAAGQFTLTINAADTDDTVSNNFVNYTMYPYGIKLFNAGGTQTPVLEGTFQVVPFVVHTTVAPT